MKNLKKFICFESDSIKKVLRNIRFNGARCSVIVNKKIKLIGTVSDGDIRKRLLRGSININDKIKSICNTKPKFIQSSSFQKSNLKKIFIKQKLDIIPLLDRKKKVIKIFLKDDFLNSREKQKTKKTKKISTPVVIMAGGLGSRLDPITKIIPKPLVPISNKTVIELITESFFNSGFKNFYYSLGYKKDLVKAYFKDHTKNYTIKYITENKPLGTAGALRFLFRKIKSSFIVTNCDSIFKIDFKELYQFHKKNNYDLTLVTTKKNFLVPYGVCDIKKNNLLNTITEKPNFKFQVLTGMYVIKPTSLKYIPNNRYFDMNQLIQKLIKNKKTVACYYINNKNWIDVGELQDYKRNVKILS
jgi:dTDP-glucose pyrophosphorylase